MSAGREVTFAFTHALIPATLYEGVSTLRRRRLHRRVAAAIERLHPKDFEALAYHYGEAGDEKLALTYHTRAGEQASAAYANVEAERYFRTALELAEIESERADLLYELGRVLDRQSRYDGAIEVWQAGIAEYQALGQQEGVARLYARSARTAWMLGDTPRGLALCREGMAAVDGAPESADLADLLHETARACHFNGLPREAGSLCRRSLEMAERLGAIRVQAEALTTLGILPDVPYEESVSTLTRAVELAESAGLLDQAARAHNNLSVRLMDAQAAREHVVRAAELERQRGEILGELFYAYRAAELSLYLGELAEVEEELPSLRRLLGEVQESGMMTLRLRLLEAMLLRHQGKLAEAVKELDTLQTEAREAGDLQALVFLDAELARLQIWEEVGEEAELEAMLRELLDLDERGMGTAVEGYSLLSVLRARQGETEAACRLLAKARETAHERGEFGFWEPYLGWAEANQASALRHWPEALAAFEAEAEVLDDRNLRWQRARTLVDWAEAHLSHGEPGDCERAGELLREAEAEFRAMGAPLYAERVKTRLHRVSP